VRRRCSVDGIAGKLSKSESKVQSVGVQCSAGYLDRDLSSTCQLVVYARLCFVVMNINNTGNGVARGSVERLYLDADGRK